MAPEPRPTDRPRILLMGPCELHAGGVLPLRPERPHQLLVLLALAGGSWMPRDRIATLLWPERALAEARRNLRKVLFVARGIAGAAGLEGDEQSLRWAVASDLRELDEAARAGRLADAVALRRGPVLGGIESTESGAFAEWLAGERARIEQAWHAAALAGLHGLTDPQARAGAARRMLEADPCDESAVAALIAAELALGRRVDALATYRRYAQRLADDLGVEPSKALRELLREPAAASAQSAPAPAAPVTAGGSAAGAFVGRRIELAQLAERLADPGTRLLTVLGPGGIGKSRLARQVLAGRDGGFDDGWCWVELEQARDLVDVVARIAERLGLMLADRPEERADPLAPLLRQLGDARWRLVLDNAEHVAHLRPALQRLLDGAGGLRLLVTSRVRLQLRGEQVLALEGLAVPDEDSQDVDAAGSFDAVRLFELRACAAQPGFRLEPHVAAVVAIVEAVAGMPLAIELAAGWVRLLPPEQVALDLKGSIDVLERDPAASVPVARAEHASLRVVMDGTWQLLAPRERLALAALAVFQGGFTRAAALAVAECSLALLSSLVDKSLVGVDERGRFSLHPVVATYAAERLAVDEARCAVLRARHARHYASHLADLAPHARGDQRPLVEGLSAEFANGRAAWRHAAEQGDATLIDAMAATWRVYFENRGRLAEGIAEMRLAMALPATDVVGQRALGKLRHALSSLLYRQGELHEAQAVAEAALPMAERLGERETLKGCLGNIGLCLWHAGRPTDARSAFERALVLAEQDGDRHGCALALSHIAIAEKALGHYERALALNAQALAMERELGNQRGVASKLNNIGNLHRARGQWREARRFFVDGLQHCHAYGLASAAPYLQLNLGLTETELGELASARAHLLAVHELMRRAGQLQVELSVELGLARIDIAERQDRSACERLARVVRQSAAKGFHTHPVQAASIYGELLAARQQPLQAAGVWLMASAEPALDEMDRQGAQALFDRLALDDTQRARAGQSMPTLEQVLAWIDADARRPV